MMVRPSGFTLFALASGCALAGLVVAGVMLEGAARDVVLSARLSPPFGPEGVFGTDQLGRDILARVIAGAPWSLAVSLGASVIAATLGTALGLLASETRGVARAFILQLANLAMAFPGLVAAVISVAVFGQSAVAVASVLGLLTWAAFTRVVYAESLAVQQRDYVLAARLGGVASRVRLVRHVLPALAPSLLVLCVFHFADMLVAASALSFLGVGAPLGAPAWGAMLAESRPYLYLAPWMLIMPAIALAGTVLALNLAGDALAKRLNAKGR